MFQEEEEGWTEENGGWNQNEEYIMFSYFSYLLK